MANSKDVVVTGVSTGIGWGTQRSLFQKDFAFSVLYASRPMPIVCKKNSVTASCLS